MFIEEPCRLLRFVTCAGLLGGLYVLDIARKGGFGRGPRESAGWDCSAMFIGLSRPPAPPLPLPIRGRLLLCEPHEFKTEPTFEVEYVKVDAGV